MQAANVNVEVPVTFTVQMKLAGARRWKVVKRFASREHAANHAAHLAPLIGSKTQIRVAAHASTGGGR